MRAAPYRLLTAALPALMLAACGEPENFDTRFNAQAENILAAANSIEAELSNHLAAAREADRAQAEMDSLANAADGAPAP